jgi:hypothetical protein
MNIVSAKYIKTTTPLGEETIDSLEADVDGVKLYVPLSVGNRHYAEIMRQVAAGTLTIADAD